MTQNEKKLLFKDLCMRLPYGVKVEIKYYDEAWELLAIYTNGTTYAARDIGYPIETYSENCKPYLFPLSSMTEEQFEELKVFADLTYEGNTLELVEWNDNCKTLEFWLEEIPSHCVIKVFDWLNKNHFDYRGLIPMGLANDATDKNIY